MRIVASALQSTTRFVVSALLGLAISAPARARADDKPPPPPLMDLPADQLEKFHLLIKPIHGEMSWRTEIPWLTNLTEARAKAAAEGKPILVWIAADGHPLGAT
jgi:hypothetical protein